MVKSVIRAVVLVDTDAQDLVGLDTERQIDLKVGITQHQPERPKTLLEQPEWKKSPLHFIMYAHSF